MRSHRVNLQSREREGSQENGNDKEAINKLKKLSSFSCHFSEFGLEPDLLPSK